jgi:DNA-binding NarL/FixJ family response regulator
MPRPVRWWLPWVSSSPVDDDGGTAHSILVAHAANASKDKTDPDPWLRQVYVLALLGRVNDGRALLEKIARQFPGNRQVRVFIDEILAAPTLDEETRQRAQAAEPCGFLSKLSGDHDLHAAIETMLARRHI